MICKLRWSSSISVILCYPFSTQIHSFTKAQLLSPDSLSHCWFSTVISQGSQEPSYPSFPSHVPPPLLRLSWMAFPCHRWEILVLSLSAAVLHISPPWPEPEPEHHLHQFAHFSFSTCHGSVGQKMARVSCRQGCVTPTRANQDGGNGSCCSTWWHPTPGKIVKNFKECLKIIFILQIKPKPQVTVETNPSVYIFKTQKFWKKNGNFKITCDVSFMQGFPHYSSC